MRKEPLLTAVPPVPVRSLSELYAIALDQAQRATQRYGAIATQMDERLSPVRSVFEALATREQNRFDSLSAACLAACGKRPRCIRSALGTDRSRVPAAEIANIKERCCRLRRLTPRGSSQPAIANAPSCSGLMSSPLPKIRWSG